MDFNALQYWLLLACALPTITYLFIYVLTNLYMQLAGPQNLKKKYNATWALVTGAGTGIGKSLAEAMAEQGLNVVLVSLPDKFLDETTEALIKKYPSQQFRKVAAKFDHKTDYMPGIIEATKDLDVSIVFNNAGYVVTGFFDVSALDGQLANMECNATACVKITHHFLQRMITKKLRGCIVFTSSVAGYIPSPFTVMYGATKAFVSQFAASLAVEVRALGIDVIAVHPSPVNSNFYDKVHKIDALEAAKAAAVQPNAVPTLMLMCIGRSHIADLGGRYSIIFLSLLCLVFINAVCLGMAVGVRAGIAGLPYDFIAGVFSYAAPILPDYRKYDANRGTVAEKKAL
jgi:short-subunit dehydrogenase